MWQKEIAMAAKKAEMAMKEKEAAAVKMGLMQRELEELQGNGQYLHAIKRISELPNLPIGVLKAFEWQLRKDLQEVEKVSERVILTITDIISIINILTYCTLSSNLCIFNLSHTHPGPEKLPKRHDRDERQRQQRGSEHMDAQHGERGHRLREPLRLVQQLVQRQPVRGQQPRRRSLVPRGKRALAPHVRTTGPAIERKERGQSGFRVRMDGTFNA